MVNDSGGGNIGILNGPGRTAIGPLTFGRGNSQSWALTPVSDPGKLERMQLLYKDAISSGLAKKTSGRRGLGAECDLKGTYCGCSIQVCSQNRAAFTRLALNVLDTALNDPPAPPAPPAAVPEGTVEVQKFSYNDDSTVKEVQKYHVRGSELGLNAVLPETGSASGGSTSSGNTSDSNGSSSRNLSSPSRSTERTRRDNIIKEQQQELLRGVLFPNN